MKRDLMVLVGIIVLLVIASFFIFSNNEVSKEDIKSKENNSPINPAPEENTISNEELLSKIYPIFEEDCEYLSQYIYSKNSASGKCPDCSLVPKENFKTKLSGNENAYQVEKTDSGYILNSTILVTYGRNTYRGTLKYSFIFDKEGNIINENKPDVQQFGCYN